MERYKGADAEGAVAKQALDQSVAAFRTARRPLRRPRRTWNRTGANVRRLEELTSFERVVAPFDGTVIQRNVDVGTLITAGSPVNNTAVAPASVAGGPNGLFEVGRIETLRVFVNVPQPFAPNVKAGLPVLVEVRGQLTQPVAAIVDEDSHRPGPRHPHPPYAGGHPERGRTGCMPGMFVYVTFKIAPSGTRWRIPSTALSFDAQGHEGGRGRRGQQAAFPERRSRQGLRGRARYPGRASPGMRR